MALGTRTIMLPLAGLAVIACGDNLPAPATHEVQLARVVRTAGLLYVLDPRTGAIADRGALDGPGHKYIEPAVIGNRVFVTSCDTIVDGPTHLEAWELTR